MATIIFLLLVAVCFALIGGIIGFATGYDEGFETALECYEEEIKYAYLQSDNQLHI